MKRLIRNVIRPSKRAYSKLHTDVYLVEYPKSGVTWLSFIIANLLIKYNELPLKTNFYNVDDFVVDMSNESNIENWPPYKIPGYRFIKSHDQVRLDFRKVVYLWRDPFDVMRSYYTMSKGLHEFKGSFPSFVESKKYGIFRWVEHVHGWLYNSSRQQKILFINYENMMNDPSAQLRCLMEVLGWTPNDEHLSAALAESEFKKMRQLEEYRNHYDLRFKDEIKQHRDYKFVGGKIEIPEKDILIAKNIVVEAASPILKRLLKVHK